jgi:hypothetical protein
MNYTQENIFNKKPNPPHICEIHILKIWFLRDTLFLFFNIIGCLRCLKVLGKNNIEQHLYDFDIDWDWTRTLIVSIFNLWCQLSHCTYEVLLVLERCFKFLGMMCSKMSIKIENSAPGAQKTRFCWSNFKLDKIDIKNLDWGWMMSGVPNNGFWNPASFFPHKRSQNSNFLKYFYKKVDLSSFILFLLLFFIKFI